MRQAYVYIILVIIFIGSGILIGWALTNSDQFNHIDSKTQKKKITWWSVCIVAICCALVITFGSAVLYKYFYDGKIFGGTSQDIWVNQWSPQQTEYATTTGYTQPPPQPSPVEYAGIPESSGIF